MNKFVLVLVFATAAAFCTSWSMGPGGLSGWPGLPCSDVLETGMLRAGVSAQFIDTDNGGIIKMPLKACWGIAEDFETGIEIPVVPLDNAFEGSVVGDITVSGGWLYEKTRGGTALKFTGRVTVPTGEIIRDRGAELAIGGVTSTTFLDFRLSMSAEYALNGGRNPFEDTLSDVMYFGAGGSSFITSDILLNAQMNGSTSSTLTAGAGAQYLLSDNLAIDGGLTVSLDGYENYGIYAGASWTGEGY